MPARLAPSLSVAALAALVSLATTPAPAASQAGANGDTFDWSGQIPAGSWLRVRNLNGAIDVEAASGSEASVHAEKRAHDGGDPSRVHFQVTKDGSSVTICALWRDGDSCDAEGYESHGHGNDHNGNVSVHFTVRLPKGVNVLASTVNGGLDVSGAQAEVRAHTVNGGIQASSSGGPVNAGTVNGTVRVSAGALGDGDLSYSTVNGSVIADLPANLDADVEMETVNGSISSDFPLSVSGRISPKHLRATIGKGGRRLKLSTVNGSVELRKHQ